MSAKKLSLFDVVKHLKHPDWVPYWIDGVREIKQYDTYSIITGDRVDRRENTLYRLPSDNCQNQSLLNKKARLVWRLDIVKTRGKWKTARLTLDEIWEDIPNGME